MSEWLKEHAWKACVGETLPWVRIPLSPPFSLPRTMTVCCRSTHSRSIGTTVTETKATTGTTSCDLAGSSAQRPAPGRRTRARPRRPAGSLVPKRREWIDPDGATRRQPCRQHADDTDDQHHATECKRVRGSDLVQQPRQPSRRYQCKSDTCGEPRCCQLRPVAEDKVDDLAGIRTKRHANADFLRSLGHEI